ncbi:MAG TPA: ABC-F family ATP-binding cassette domain-containing protein [Anaerolineaceae bacterium]|nr:ABC-F family ATP-binding cassette domain-containing protein [Anaerolineaceae bacterium]
MALLSATNLAKSYGPNDLFSGVTFSIPHRARIALVGPNGVGKTTLLRILLGLEDASAGDVQRSKALTIGYLPQEAQLNSEHSLWDECLTPFAHLLKMQSELSRLESQMSDSVQADAALAAYGPLQASFDLKGGYNYEQRIRQTLTGLGFSTADYQRPVTQLSGGQRTRALLAQLLLSDPDLLLLDEPTNHLDIAAVEWLETYLKEWDGAVLVVSHDRYFLDQVAQLIWEMTPAFEVYHGNYSAYLTQRAERYTRRLEEFQTQQEFIEKEEEYIRRNIAGQNTRQAQGRRKRLERLLEETALTPPIKEARRLHVQLTPIMRSGDLVVRTYDLAVGYADEGRPLFTTPDLIFRRGECAAIIGPNGAGKTTFLKTLLGQIPPFSGDVDVGASLQIGYFAQAHEGLRAERDLIQEIQSVAPQMQPGEVREYLAKFLFTGDDAFKLVEVLSGGERSRLALAKLALSGANLLLLDEPTNHLDLPSQEVLQNILANFNGSILLVSHDRYLIDALATQVWEVEPEQASLRVFEGTYSEYRTAREAEADARKAASATPENGKAPRIDTRAKNAPAIEERRRKARLEDLENRIAEVEQNLAAVSRQLETPPDDPGLVQRLGSDYVRLEKDLNDLLTEWDQIAG